MKIIRPEIFRNCKNIIAATSTKIENSNKSEFGFNLSFKVGDDENLVNSNRKKFADAIGINLEQIANLDQIHSNKIIITNQSGNICSGDALISATPNIFISVTTADCVPILLFDETKNIVAAIHAGWKGTELKITSETIKTLISEFSVSPKNLKAYIGASASKCCYNVSEKVAKKFSKEVVEFYNSSFYVDLKKENKMQLLSHGLKESQIEISNDCTICNLDFHSFRRDKEKSGRMISLIGIKN
ncbi:MAG: peptidoglycan editing factor PgeF [Bacteroidota bacterium]